MLCNRTVKATRPATYQGLRSKGSLGQKDTLTFPPTTLQELIPVKEPAPIAPAVEVAGVEGEDDAWYIPPIMHHQIHALDKYLTLQVEPVLEYVEERMEDPVAGPPQYNLAADGLEDELWVNPVVQAWRVE